MRLDPAGDPAKVIVEQRPLLDWITIRAAGHTVHPGQKLSLKGFGREPVVMDSRVSIPTPQVARYDTNFSPAERFDPDADTIALYHCDEGQGEALTDSSGNHHHGLIKNATWTRAD